MQHHRFIRLVAQMAAIALIVAFVWIVGAAAGNHLPPWGILVLIIAICAMFGAALGFRSTSHRDHD
jgi:NADH:ubiquinone oxidoreductase subunit 2 (subunit N)